jgi:hypothetical protein
VPVAGAAAFPAICEYAILTLPSRQGIHYQDVIGPPGRLTGTRADHVGRDLVHSALKARESLTETVRRLSATDPP